MRLANTIDLLTKRDQAIENLDLKSFNMLNEKIKALTDELAEK
jgi:hypothetical protein